MFTRYMAHGVNQRRKELLPRSTARCLKRRWNALPFQSSSCLTTCSSEANFQASFKDSESNAGRRRQQHWRDFRSSTPKMSERPIHTTASRHSSPVAASLQPRLDDDDDCNNNGDNERVFSNSHDWLSRSFQRNEDRWYAGASSSSACPSLEDQLGETNVWDMASLVEDDSEEEDESVSSEGSDLSWMPERKEYPPTKKYSGVDVMKNFDAASPPKTQNLEDIQLWLECESHLESAMKYQKVISSARNRKDFSSLPMVQRQLVRWHEPLKNAIEARQTEFVVKRLKTSYAPYLCALPAQKLAVVTAHETVTYLLANSGRNSQRGCPLVTVAQRIGDAVEEEVDVQRVLRKRAKESRTGRPSVTNTSTEERETKTDPSGTTDDARDHFDDMIETWTYGASHLRQFMEELTKKSNSQGTRRHASLAVKRARQLLERDQRWPASEKVRVGVDLLSALINDATIKINGVEHKAFSYERRVVKWRHMGYVTLNDEFYKMVTEDSYQQLNPFSTRLKPMVVPSRKWVAPNDGGYCWLKVDLMRFHGCEMQRVSVFGTGALEYAVGRLKQKVFVGGFAHGGFEHSF